jgi:hypothetical protein
MNIKAIIASLVLGSSSIAMAAPGVTVSATARGEYGNPVVRDHHVDDDRDRPVVIQPAPDPTYHRVGWNGGGHKLPPVYRPVTLASGLRFANNGRTFIAVGSQAGQFGALQISAAGGRTYIKQVTVQFGNGQQQVIRDLDRTLSGNESLTLDLDGGRRNISRIVVYGNAASTGWRRSAGAFTVTAS